MELKLSTLLIIVEGASLRGGGTDGWMGYHFAEGPDKVVAQSLGAGYRPCPVTSRRNATFANFPVAVFGMAGTNRTSSGSHHDATRPVRCSRN